MMNQKQVMVVQLLATVVAHEKDSLFEALQALGHGIAVLSTSQGERARQSEFLDQIFSAIRHDAEEMMQVFDAHRGIDQPITATAQAEAAKILSKYWKASSNG